MEIITLLKANIRHKKGSFASIIILMIIISMSLTAILSVRYNCETSIENALNHVNAGDLNLFITKQNMTDELINSVLNNEMVDSVVDYPAVSTIKSETNGDLEVNSWSLLKLRPEIKLFNSDLSGYSSEVPQLKSGEIYITQGVCTNMKCDVGDTIKIYTIGGDVELKIAGIIEEPVNGAAVMGWKQLFISDEDFDRLYEECMRNETETSKAIVHILKIFKTDGTITDAKFRRQLNLETGIVDNSLGSITKEMSIYYSSLFPEIICSALMVFICFLIIVVFIVMGHSISTGIEMDYVNLGVLKSQGFSKGKIRAVFVLQYILAQIIGILVGMFFAIPLTKALGNVFQPITAVVAETNILVIKSLLIMLVVLLLSVILIILMTRKIGRISPIRALSNGQEQIYFDSRIKAPIIKRALAPSIAVRQFTSNKRQYIGMMLIVAILVFFMSTIMILGSSVNSKSAVESMGQIITEVSITYKGEMSDVTLNEIDHIVEEYSSVEKKYYLETGYLSVDGEAMYCFIYKDPEMIPAILKGRAPLCDNEIVITEIVAEEFSLEIGDMVTVSRNDNRGEYIISGLYRSMNDAGLCFAISLDGAKKLGFKNVGWCGYSLSDPSKAEQIVEALNSEFGDIIEARVQGSGISNTYNSAIIAMQAVIYIFSVIFALVVVHMVCSKTFLREKTDIGIYKSLGFTSANLRLQFAVRFLIVSIIGSVVGTVASVLFTGRILSLLLRGVGISSFAVEFTVFTFLVPVALICVCFFVFSYLAARKVKLVEVRELVVE